MTTDVEQAISLADQVLALLPAHHPVCILVGLGLAASMWWNVKLTADKDRAVTALRSQADKLLEHILNQSDADG